jgi:threonine dehydratase
VYLPTTASASKKSKLEDAGASLVLYGEDPVIAETEARKISIEDGIPYISPYNDMQVRLTNHIQFF